jgi:CRISPR-associated protein Csb3
MLIRADYRNVAEYLAGLGFLEATSWFEAGVGARWTDEGIEIIPLDDELFRRVIGCFREAQVEFDLPACKNPAKPPKESPLLLKVAGKEVPLNSWLDHLLEKKSVWSPGISGQVAVMMIVRNAIDHIKKIGYEAKSHSIFGKEFAINGCPQFRLDGSAAWTTIDIGFSPNDAAIEIAARPFVELFSILGAQSFFPQVSSTRRENPQYFVWDEVLPLPICRLAARGAIPVRTRKFTARWLDAGSYGALSFAEEL